MKSLNFSSIDLSEKKLSKGHKKLVKYISENYDKAAFMTASKLGETVGVSESTVVRFATEMGFKGYPELQKELQQMRLKKLNVSLLTKLKEKHVKRLTSIILCVLKKMSSK